MASPRSVLLVSTCICDVKVEGRTLDCDSFDRPIVAAIFAQ